MRRTVIHSGERQESQVELQGVGKGLKIILLIILDPERRTGED